MDQLICASLSHTHYLYEVGMFKVLTGMYIICNMYVCMYVCMYVFIKLHITTQSGPVILVILCHSH